MINLTRGIHSVGTEFPGNCMLCPQAYCNQERDYLQFLLPVNGSVIMMVSQGLCDPSVQKKHANTALKLCKKFILHSVY